VGAARELPGDYARFFRALGQRIRSYRTDRGLSQEAMVRHGFSLRHWQMIESGRPITVFTLLRISDTFGLAPEELVAGLTGSKKGRKSRRSTVRRRSR